MNTTTGLRELVKRGELSEANALTVLERDSLGKTSSTYDWLNRRVGIAKIAAAPTHKKVKAGKKKREKVDILTANNIRQDSVIAA